MRLRIYLHTIIVALFSSNAFAQVYMDTSSMTVISNARTANEGDLYLDTTNNIYRIGLTNGKLGYAIDNQDIDSISLIQDSLLAIYITRGKSDTVNLANLSLLNKNWYEIGTARPANDITDDIYTGGNIRLDDYPNTRSDALSDHLNELYTDANGNVLSARREIIPPPITIDVSTASSGTFNYYNHYATQLTNAGLTPIPLANLDFYVLYFDNLVFSAVSISATGVLSYNVIGTAESDNRIINVVFYTK